jgi:hypothetical protein
MTSEDGPHGVQLIIIYDVARMRASMQRLLKSIPRGPYGHR